MKGFKSIEELSLKECYEFLISEEYKKHPLYPAISERYEEMLWNLEKQDNSDYAACKTIENYEAYIKKFSSSSIAPYYKAKHIDETKNAIEELFWNFHKRSVGGCKEYLNRYPQGKYASIAYSRIESSKKTKWLVLGIVLIVLIITFFVGYKPVNSLAVSETSLSFDKWGGTESVHISTNVSTNAVEVRCSGSGFDTEEDNGFDFKVSAGANEGDSRTGTVKVIAYATLYGMRIGDETEKTIKMMQESGLANFLEVGHNIELNKWGESVTFHVNTDGVKVTAESPDEWIHIKKAKGNNYIITADKNPADTKVGSIIVSSGMRSKRVVVYQASGLAKDIRIDRDEINWVAKTGTAPDKYLIINVETDGTTYSVSHPSWTNITVYDKYFTITVDEADNVREGSIVVKSNNGHSRTIKIYQDGNPTSFYADYSKWTFDTDSDYKYIYINNNSHQTVYASTNKSSSSWLTASISDNYVRISCERNDNEPRSGTVTLKCGDKETKINVRQKGFVYENCDRCERDIWGNPLGFIYVGPFGSPWWHQEPCPKCKGKRILKRKSN